MKKTFLFLFSTISLFSVAQNTANPLSLTKGQRLSVTTNLNVTSQSIMGPSSGTITMADEYSVNEAASGTFTLVKVPKKMKMDFSMGGQEIKMDSDNPNDLEGMLGGPVKEIMSQKPEFTIDAAGRVTSVKQDDKKGKENGAPNMMGMMLPGMDLSSSMPQVGSPSIFQVLPANEIKAGDTWTDSLNQENNKNVTVYKVKEITNNEIIVDFTSEGTTVTSQETMGMSIEVKADSKASGNIIVDKATRLPKQKTVTSTTEMNMNLAGREMTATTKVTGVTNVTTL